MSKIVIIGLLVILTLGLGYCAINYLPRILAMASNISYGIMLIVILGLWIFAIIYLIRKL